MSVAKVTELKASSTKSFEDAIREGMRRTNKTIRHVKSAWVKDLEVRVDDKGEITEYRVLLKVTFILED